MARTIVITGGTRGIGLALARSRIDHGDTMVAVGSSQVRGAQFVEATGGRFVAADLSSMAATRDAAARIAAEHPRIDALVLGANRLTRRREETAEGLESVFALYHLSRRVMAEALREQLLAADEPVVLNLSGPGITTGTVVWDDLQLTRRWSSMRAQLQAGRANDLLGVALAADGGPTRHIVYNPGFTDTRPYPGMAQPWRAVAELAAGLTAAPPERTATAINTLLNNPPQPGFSAWRRRGETNTPIDPGLRTFTPADAQRLTAATDALLAAVAR